MRVLVTGGSGFLGTHVVSALVAKGYQVRCLARSPRPTTIASEVEWISGSLANLGQVERALEGVETIFHLAGQVSFRPADARSMYELHVDATRGLLQTAERIGLQPRIVLASTSGTVAVSATARVANESDRYPIEIVGRWPYYASKIYEEQLVTSFCKKRQWPLVILNPSLLMGPGDERLSSTWTVVKFLQRDIPAMPGGGMSFADVRDVASAAVRAATSGDLYGRHLMGVNMSMQEFFSRLERLTGVPAPRVRLPKAVNVLGAQVLNKLQRWRGEDAKLHPQEVEIGEHWFWLDSAKAERELGYRATDPYETLSDTVEDTLRRMPQDLLPGVRGKLREKRSGSAA